MDGVHAARFCVEVQGYLESPLLILGERAERPGGDRPRRAKTPSRR